MGLFFKKKKIWLTINQQKKKDLKEIKSLLIFISGITEKTPIRRVEFTKYKDLDVISIDRWLMNLKANF